jgi:hypothetical protein
MPESTLDRLVLVLGICALAGLVALIVPEWRSYTAGDSSTRASAPPLPAVTPPPPSAPVTTEVSPSARSVPPGSHSATTATPSSPVAKPAKPLVATLRLLAERGDCWVEARTGSASGRQLYFGMLPQGQELVLSGRAVWLRLGAPQNLDGWIGTKRVRSLPSAAATVVATPAGVRTVALG